MNLARPGVPIRQIRAQFEEQTVRVYQAYSDEIADQAMAAQTFISPFKRGRMTWIKPSFTWMMYRSAWGSKSEQNRILGIDVSRTGFDWALAHSSVSHFDPAMHSSMEEWQQLVSQSPVRIQWDPERTLTLEAVPWRAIQVGLGGPAAEAYVDEWIVRIEDMTSLAHDLQVLVARHELDAAHARRPVEKPYPLRKELASRIGCTVIDD